MRIDLKDPEYTCPICGRVYSKYKGLHGHMLLAHREEYAANGYSLTAYGIMLDPMERLYRQIAKAGRVIETTAGAEIETR